MVWFPARARYVSLIYSVQTGCIILPACSRIVEVFFSPGLNGRDVKLSSHFYLVPRLRTRGTTFRLFRVCVCVCVYVCMAQ